MPTSASNHFTVLKMQKNRSKREREIMPILIEPEIVKSSELTGQGWQRVSEITGSRRWYVQSLERAAPHGEAQPSGGLGIRKFFSAVFASPSVSHEGAAGYQVVGPVRKSDLVVVVARATTLDEAREMWSALNQRGVLHLRPAAPSSSAREYAQLTEALQGIRRKGKTSQTQSSSPSKSPAENSSSRLFALFSERS